MSRADSRRKKMNGLMQRMRMYPLTLLLFQYIPSRAGSLWPVNHEIRGQTGFIRFNATTDLLNIRNFGRESMRNLRDDFLDEGLVLHGLSCFHDTGKRSGVS